MKLGKLHHIGIAVPSLSRAARYYVEVIGGQLEGGPLTSADGSMAIQFVRTQDALIELLEPLTANSAIARFLADHPQGGQHHLCFEVGDIHAARQWFADRGATFETPIVTGVLGHPIFFMNDAAMGATAIELIQID